MNFSPETQCLENTRHSELIRVFVYGTLKPGEENYPIYCEQRVVDCVAAIAPGTLYALPMGYPAMAPGTAPVHGFLLTFTDAQALRDLDELEDYDPARSPAENEYGREWIEVFDPDGRSLGFAWVYCMSATQAQAWGGVVVKTGNWSVRLLD